MIFTSHEVNLNEIVVHKKFGISEVLRWLYQELLCAVLIN